MYKKDLGEWLSEVFLALIDVWEEMFGFYQEGTS